MREHVEGGDRLADTEIADHTRVEELLKQMEWTDADDSRMRPLDGHLLSLEAQPIQGGVTAHDRHGGETYARPQSPCRG
ncbi:hypothetical protein [Streptomyces sp. YIM S03343]